MTVHDHISRLVALEWHPVFLTVMRRRLRRSGLRFLGASSREEELSLLVDLPLSHKPGNRLGKCLTGKAGQTLQFGPVRSPGVVFQVFEYRLPRPGL